VTAAAQKVYVDDTGTRIILDCGQDVSAATAREIVVRKPDGTSATWAAEASGTDAIAYTTLADTLDQAGRWRLQARVTLPTGVWRGSTVDLLVYRHFA
jgi:hypothetical protein